MGFGREIMTVSEVALGPVQVVAVLGDAIVTFLRHTLVTISNVSVQELKAILNAILGLGENTLQFLTLLLHTSIVSEHLTVSEGHGLKGVHGVSCVDVTSIGSSGGQIRQCVPVRQLSQGGSVVLVPIEYTWQQQQLEF